MRSNLEYHVGTEDYYDLHKVMQDAVVEDWSKWVSDNLSVSDDRSNVDVIIEMADEINMLRRCWHTSSTNVSDWYFAHKTVSQRADRLAERVKYLEERNKLLEEIMNGVPND